MFNLKEGSMFLGIIVALILSMVLWWIPILGPLLAGFVAGYVAKEGVGKGFIIGLIGGIVATIIVIIILYALGIAFFGPLGFFITLFLSFGISIASIEMIILVAIGGALGGLVSMKK